MSMLVVRFAGFCFDEHLERETLGRNARLHADDVGVEAASTALGWVGMLR